MEADREADREADSGSRELAESLFARALDAGGGRTPDLEALCRAHPEVAGALRQVEGDWRRVERLFAGTLGVQRTLSERLASCLGTTRVLGLELEPRPVVQDGAAAAGDSLPSQTIGRLATHAPKLLRYELLREVGRGSMGAVLEVWDPDLRRTLAMKVVLAAHAPRAGSGPVDETVLARFLEEAQVTGQLDHPGIVPVHELGLDSEGRVYFTMRLVKGRDLGAIFERYHNGEEGWSLTRLVQVLLKVCEAMAYAHEKSVIHRDLKPANIMVGPFGEVYVMDWGLARVLRREQPVADGAAAPAERAGPSSGIHTDRRDSLATERLSPLRTMAGDVMGTPPYMPPEQARGQIELLDARSDVYSLGAILYYLLAGHAPYVPPGHAETPASVCGLVREGPPAALALIAKSAPPELVAIVEKAMARERDARYASMLAFAADLQSWLEGRVVRAYEAGALAELRKWVRRNRATAISSAAAILVLLGGLGSVAFIQSRAKREVQRERDAGERVIEFLVGLFESPDPREARGETITAKELLDRGARSVEGYVGADALVWTRLMDGMGEAYHSLGLYREAEPLVRDAHRHRLAELGPEHADTLSSANDLARVWRDAGRLVEAEELYASTLAVAERVLGPRAPETLRTVAELAKVRFFQGRYAEAEELHTRALAGRKAVLGEDHADTSLSRTELALLYRKQARYDEARALLEETLASYERLHGAGAADHPDTLKCLNDLAGTHALAGRLDEAEALYERTLAARVRVLGEDHPDTLITKNDLASLYYQQGMLGQEGRLAEAQELYERALAAYRAVDADHPQALAILTNLASIYWQLERADEAEELFLEAVERNVRVRGEAHPNSASALNGLAYLYAWQGRTDEAQPLYERALAGHRAALGADHPNTLQIAENLASLYVAQGAFARALPLAEELVQRTPAESASREARAALLASIRAALAGG